MFFPFLHSHFLLTAFLKIDLKKPSTGKKLYWNEYGVGGGTTQDGKNKALTAQQAAATPFFGVSGRYNRSRDPWTLFDPVTPNPVRDYLRYFYGQTLNYASSRVGFFDLKKIRNSRERERRGRATREKNPKKKTKKLTLSLSLSLSLSLFLN